MIDLDDFEDQLSTLARRWEADAPPITVDEVIAIVGRRGLAALIDPDDADLHGPDESLVAVSPIAVTPNRRWKPLVMIGAAAALVLVGLVVLAQRDGNNQEPFRPGIDTIAAPQPTATVPATSTPATSTPATISGTSPAPPTTPPSAEVADPTTQELSTIQSSVSASLATFDTFRATATMQSATSQGSGGELVDGPVTINEVTMAADGSVWATGSPITWQSYDATTGIARTANPSANAYMQLNLNPVPLGLVMGLAPLPRFDEFGTDVVVDETDQDGRPVWEINSIHDSAGADGIRQHRDETFEIDKATGLVIGYTKTSTASGTTTVQTATLSNLVLNVDFPPPDFPGTFPPDADVPASGGQNPIQLLNVDEAATRFGAGFVVAPALPRTARITFQSNLVPTAGPGGTVIVGPPRLTVTMDFPTGFAPTSLTISKDAAVGDSTSSGDAGSVCRTVDGKTCLGADGASVVIAGALKGVPSELRLGVLTIHNGLITVVIRASSDQDALALANSLVTVG